MKKQEEEEEEVSRTSPKCLKNLDIFLKVLEAHIGSI